METLLRVLFLVAAVSFFLFILALIFSIFLIIWPFLAIGLLASIAYAWISKYMGPPRNGGGAGETTIHQTERTIIIEHEEQKKD